MNWLKSILRQIIALFVDDGRFALSILVWVLLLRVLFPHLPLPLQWHAPLLLVGLLAILVENLWRSVRPPG